MAQCPVQSCLECNHPKHCIFPCHKKIPEYKIILYSATDQLVLRGTTRISRLYCSLLHLTRVHGLSYLIVSDNLLPSVPLAVSHKQRSQSVTPHSCCFPKPESRSQHSLLYLHVWMHHNISIPQKQGISAETCVNILYKSKCFYSLNSLYRIFIAAKCSQSEIVFATWSKSGTRCTHYICCFQ